MTSTSLRQYNISLLFVFLKRASHINQKKKTQIPLRITCAVRLLGREYHKRKTPEKKTIRRRWGSICWRDDTISSSLFLVLSIFLRMGAPLYILVRSVGRATSAQLKHFPAAAAGMRDGDESAVSETKEILLLLLLVAIKISETRITSKQQQYTGK